MTAVDLYELHQKKSNPYNYARVQIILGQMREFIEQTGMESFRTVQRVNKKELAEIIKYLCVLDFRVVPNLLLEDTVTQIHDYELLIYFDFAHIDKQFDLLPPIEPDCNKE